MNIIKRNPIILGILLLVSSCGRDSNTAKESPVPFLHHADQQWADSLLQTLDITEKISQLILWDLPAPDSQAISLFDQIPYTGGVLLHELPLLRYIDLIDSLKNKASLPLFFASKEPSLINDQFRDVVPAPNMSLLNAQPSDSLRAHINELAAKQAIALQINLYLGQLAGYERSAGDQLWQERVPAFNNRKIISLANQFSDFYPNMPDTSGVFERLLKPGNALIQQGVGGFILDPQLPIPAMDEKSMNYDQYFQEKLSFDGIIARKSSAPSLAIQHLLAGVDLVIVSAGRPQEFVNAIQAALEQAQLEEQQIDQKVKKILLAKKWMHNGFLSNPFHQESIYQPVQASIPGKINAGPLQRKSISIDLLYKHFIETDWKYFNYQVNQSALTLLSNPDNTLPIRQINGKYFRIIQYDQHSFREFKSQFQKYADYQVRRGKLDEQGALTPIIKGRSNYFNIILLNGQRPNPKRDLAFFDGLQIAHERGNLVFVNFGPVEAVAALGSSYTIIQAYELNDDMEKLSAQLIFGGIAAQGKTPVNINPDWPIGTGFENDKTRLSYTNPKEVGIRPEKLVGINAIANSAIRKKATPGCQVIVAKEGKIIYNQSFGYHTYRKKKRVQNSDIYDIASLTKISSTTLVSMYQYQSGYFQINDRIKDHLPEFKKAPFKNVRIKEIMTHRSGIQPHLPVIPYLLYRGPNNTACDSFFCKNSDDTYSIQVADQFFLKKQIQDSIWQNLNKVKVRRTKYKYSDVNFVLMQRLLETKSKGSLDQLAAQHFYTPLGLRNTFYKPLEKRKKESIIPTEKDEKWRQQQIHGYVHDESAALFGGVAGHAGLFSNAEDLVVILQMLLNKGSYGDRSYLNPETIELFTEARHGNHRGLGFDKPHSSNRSGRAYEINSSAFGHTGFTGTCAWVDPANDLVYVFLSNRVFPNARNRKLFKEGTRNRIHQVVYDAMASYQENWPDLTI